jgi:hypothetical protein
MKTRCHYAVCRCVEYRKLCIAAMNVIMLSVVMLSVVKLRVVMLSIVMLNVVAPNKMVTYQQTKDFLCSI